MEYQVVSESYRFIGLVQIHFCEMKKWDTKEIISSDFQGTILKLREDIFTEERTQILV